MSGDFSDPVIAGKTRDVMDRLIQRVIDRERPPTQYATVDSINPDQRSAYVTIQGSSTSVKVSMGSIQPTAVGQVVRVAGHQGDKFIVDVIGRASVTDTPTTDLVAPTGLVATGEPLAVYVQWNAVTGASQYEVQFASDAAFTTLVRNFLSSTTNFHLGNLTSGEVVYVRVRARSNSGAGAWSASATATAAALGGGGGTDGSPPASSPTAVVTGTLGWLLVEWTPVANQDLVTYEVHLSTLTGFVPDATTKVGETTGTFYSVAALPGGTGRLAYNTTYFIRLIAKDADGAAAVGAQGSDTLDQVNTADAGNIAGSEISDGVAPSTSPAIALVSGGPGWLFLKWAHAANPDALKYQVHVSRTLGFIPDANTLVLDTPSNFAFVRREGPGATPANRELEYGITYYLRIIATDNDGEAPPGAENSGQMAKVSTVDIAVGAISAGSGIIGNLAVDTAHIADLAVSNAKIAELSVSAGKIQDLAVGTAKIADLAVNNAKIAGLAVDAAKIADLAVTNAKIADLAVTGAKIANATIGTAQISSLSADLITVGTMNAARINGGDITGVTITGVTLTGAYRSTSGWPRVDIAYQSLDGSIRFYNSGGSSQLLYLGSSNLYTNGTFEAGSQLRAIGAVFAYGTQLVPPGLIALWYGSIASIPAGWALCNGATVNGFVTPDLRGRMVIGASTDSAGFASGSSYTQGGTGGSQSITLAASQIASHNHASPTGLNSVSHSHSVSFGFEGRTDTNGTGTASRVVDIDAQGAGSGTVNYTATVTSGTNSASHSHSITSGGGDGSFDNRPLWMALAYIMRVNSA